MLLELLTCVEVDLGVLAEVDVTLVAEVALLGELGELRLTPLT